MNKIKESDFGKKISEMFSNLKDKAGSFLLGEKTGPNGERSGGLFSETANALKDIGTNVKESIIGKKGPDGKPLPLEEDNSVVGNIKRMFKGVTGNIKNALGIESSDETFGTKLANTMDSMFNRIKERASEWSDNLFGQKDEDGRFTNKLFNSEFASQFKEDQGDRTSCEGSQADQGEKACVCGSVGSYPEYQL